MFYLNEKVVYPGHGVAEVSRILEKNIGGKLTTFFELKFMSNNMTMLIPVSDLQSIRKISSEKDIDDLYQSLSERREFRLQINAASWSKRNKHLQHEIGSGDIKKIAEVYKQLRCMEKDLSFGEKEILGRAELFLSQEISVVSKIDQKIAIDSLRSSVTIDGIMIKASKKTKI